MINTLLGKKIDQTQKFLENGKRVPVTLIAVSDNAVLQVKTVAVDGYSAMQLGHGTKKKPTKAASGHSKKAGFDKTSQIIKEVRLEEGDAPVAGENLAVDAVFKPGDIVTVSGTSKGKGFAGVVKRHNFRGGPKTHGQSDRERAPGSIGQTTTPGRVYRGKKMAGRMGSDKVSVANLTVVGIDPETKMLLVAGLVPGNKQSVVLVTKTGERKNFSELLESKVKREAAEAASNAAAAIEAEKAAKLAEKEAAKAPKVVADATETVVVAKDSVGSSVEEVKVEATVSEPEVVTKEEAVTAPAEEVAVEEVSSTADAKDEKTAEPAADETVTEVTEQTAEEVKEEAALEEEKK